MSKIKGKRGFYSMRKENGFEFFKHFSHDTKTNWERKTHTALVDNNKGEIAIYCAEEKKYLICKGNKSLLFKVGKIMKSTDRVGDILNRMVERGLYTNLVWSFLEFNMLDVKNHLEMSSLAWRY